MPDFTFHQERMSNVCLLTPVSDEAHEWLAANIESEAYYFGTSVAVEYRYANNILEGITEDGLTVEAA